MPSKAPNRRPHRSRAYTLIEVIAAIGLISATLVSSMQLMRDSMELSERVDSMRVLSVWAIDEVENRMSTVAYDWQNTSFSGDYATYSYPDFRYETVCSDALADGGIPGLLMDIRTTTYHDLDGDDSFDAGEPNCTFRTKFGQFATYQALGQ